ncbi:TIGR04255 family protein [Ideonella sp.]|uniref:TIGR04255 family protein n=1 Tax=Ideonella sp. TaxID=1929293 RepID=UPI0035B2F5FB
MTVHFENAPLVELIAELRWQPTGGRSFVAAGMDAPLGFSMVDGLRLEDFYLRFAAEMFGMGYQQSERLAPAGFALDPSRAAIRFRKQDGSDLFQIGPGVFTANAVPPYTSWNEFSPTVKRGVEALLKARSDEDKASPFTLSLIRYIDAFGGALLAGRSHHDFMREVLGFDVSLPPAVAGWLDSEPKLVANAAYTGVLRDNRQFSLTVGDGSNRDQECVVLDLTLTSHGPIDPSVDGIMDAFAKSRDVAHDIFVKLTTKISSVMKPVERSSK